jgi:3,4-dihydroxy 2-butanone 4-phosphate synthase/GTP cyclohydrolase II
MTISTYIIGNMVRNPQRALAHRSGSVRATPLERLSEEFCEGRPVLVAALDGAVATLATAAARIDSERLDRLEALSRDIAVLALGRERCRELGLAPVTGRHGHLLGVRLAGPIDAVASRGRSSAARAGTIRIAADPASGPGEVIAPGHVHVGAVAEVGSTPAAAALELARFAGEQPAIVLGPLLDRRGDHLSLREATRLPALRRVAVAAVDELFARMQARATGDQVTSCELPTRLGAFRIVATETSDDGELAVTLIHGDIGGVRDGVVRSHTACLLGDTFGSLACDCHARLERATTEIIAAGAGVLVYRRPASADPFRCPGACAA